MKKVKILASLAALMTLGLAACNNETPTESASDAATSQTASKTNSATASKQASSKPASSKSTGPDYTQVIAHTWQEGTPAANSSGKNYIPLTDGAKVGVKIAIADYTVEAGAAEGTGLSSGKVVPQNNHDAILTYKIKAAKAGDYQVVMKAKCSDGAESRTMDERYFVCTLNGASVDVGSDRAPLTTTSAEFVAVPTVHLTGEEDTFTFTAPDYRPVFDMDSFIVFAEH